MAKPTDETADSLRSVTGSGEPDEPDEPVTPTQPVHPYVHVVVVAVIGAVSVLAWLFVYETINRFLWDNDVRDGQPVALPGHLPARSRSSSDSSSSTGMRRRTSTSRCSTASAVTSARSTGALCP